MTDRLPEQFFDLDGNPVSLDTLCRKEPEWAANRIRKLSAAPDLSELRALVEKMRKSSEYSLQHGHHAAGKEAEHWADELDALIERIDGHPRPGG